MGGKYPPKSSRKAAANFSMGTATPPETPAASPMAQRKNNGRVDDSQWPQKAQQSRRRRPHPLAYPTTRTALPHPAAPSPIATGVSVPPHLRYSQISPQSPLSDLSEPEFLETEDMESSSSSEEDSDDETDSNPPASPRRRCSTARPTSRVFVSPSPDACPAIEVEELTDRDPMDSDRDDAIKPAGYESADSDGSRPTSRNGPRNARGEHWDLDRDFMENLQNLTCSNDSDDDELDADEAAVLEFGRRQKELKRRNRILHGSSVGKRTVSERGGDSDREDLKPFINGENPVSDRRTRRRVGEGRGGGIFHDHTPERIPELDEPDSGASEDDSDDDFARELRYFDLEIMEVDDSD